MCFLFRFRFIHRLWIALATLLDRFINTNNALNAPLWPQTIPCIDDRSRSSYMADANNNGIAAMTHSNRCISLIDTSTMKRIGEINGLTRTVWTLCFHPFDSNLLATGCLGGTVCVFRKTVSATVAVEVAARFRYSIRQSTNWQLLDWAKHLLW